MAGGHGPKGRERTQWSLTGKKKKKLSRLKAGRSSLKSLSSGHL